MFGFLGACLWLAMAATQIWLTMIFLTPQEWAEPVTANLSDKWSATLDWVPTWLTWRLLCSLIGLVGGIATLLIGLLWLLPNAIAFNASDGHYTVAETRSVTPWFVFGSIIFALAFIVPPILKEISYRLSKSNQNS